MVEKEEFNDHSVNVKCCDSQMCESQMVSNEIFLCLERENKIIYMSLNLRRLWVCIFI